MIAFKSLISLILMHYRSYTIMHFNVKPKKTLDKLFKSASMKPMG